MSDNITGIVRPLHWRGHVGKAANGDIFELDFRNGQWGFTLNGFGFTIGVFSGDRFSSEDDARLGARLLHERRILSAITLDALLTAAVREGVSITFHAETTRFDPTTGTFVRDNSAEETAIAEAVARVKGKTNGTF